MDQPAAIPDRRPLNSRSWPIMQRLSTLLVAMRVSPNLISILGMLAAIIAGVLLAMTDALTSVSGWQDRALYALAALCIQARLLANLLDGMVAIEGGTRSAVGELYNDVPDRIADCAVLIGAGYAANSIPEFGWCAAVLALFVTYIRVLGKSCGAPSDFRGPMAKPHRMALITAACLWLALAPESLRPSVAISSRFPELGLMSLALALICIGCIITAIRRLARLSSHLKSGSVGSGGKPTP
jgi:phosphatidylglycerophosphate synthase